MYLNAEQLFRQIIFLTIITLNSNGYETGRLYRQYNQLMEIFRNIVDYALNKVILQMKLFLCRCLL